MTRVPSFHHTRAVQPTHACRPTSARVPSGNHVDVLIYIGTVISAATEDRNLFFGQEDLFKPTKEEV